MADIAHGSLHFYWATHWGT